MEDKIMQTFREFKLVNSLFKTKFRIDKDIIFRNNIPQEQVEHLAINDMVMNLSRKIVNDLKSSIVKDETHVNFTEFSCELLVLKMSDFKSIVECAISLMPESEIQKLRNTNLPIK